MDTAFIIIGVVTAVILIIAFIVILIVYYFGSRFVSHDTSMLIVGILIELFIIFSGISLFATLVMPFLTIGFVIVMNIYSLFSENLAWYNIRKAYPTFIIRKLSE